MPSLQAQFFTAMTRLFVKRRHWGGNEQEVVRRARNLFGSPPFLKNFWTKDLDVQPVKTGGVRGEWIEPENFDPEAVILYVHGGGFMACSAKTHRPITTTLARNTNFRVLSLNYRLAPEYRFPAATDDIFAAYKWLLSENIRPQKIAFAGDSAGGNLILSTLLRLRDEGLPLPACAVCFSPWADLTERDPTGFDEKACAMFYPTNGIEFARVYLGETSAQNKYASPLLDDLAGLPPLLLQVSSTELLRGESQRIHDKIQQAGGVSELAIYNGLFHCWQMMSSFMPEAKKALRQASEFIKQYVPESSTPT